MWVIDLNCDLAEGFGNEAALMPWITSANLACGAHAGDEVTMRRVAVLAERHGVAIGAHPGFADREHFGRRELSLEPSAIFALVRAQIRILQAFAPVVHVKPHGALYNLATRDALVARSIAEAVQSCGPDLWLVGQAGGELVAAGKAVGLRVAPEAFADRTYRADGRLTARSRVDALIADPDIALAQVLALVRDQMINTVDHTLLSVGARTVCVHGDAPSVENLVRHLRIKLGEAGVDVRTFAS